MSARTRCCWCAMAAKVSAVGAHCTHYHGPLADGLVVGDTVRCPWHHACFDLAHRRGAGRAGAEPARLLAGRGARRHGSSSARRSSSRRAREKTGAASERIVIVGGGAAGFAAAEMLRRHGFAGTITMLSNDDAAPVDRPNLSKDYLAGSAPEDWVPLRGDDWYAENKIDLRLKTEVDRARSESEAAARSATAARSSSTSCCWRPAPSRCSCRFPGADQPHVHTLRSLADCRAIIAQREGRQARGRDRRELHRPRSRGVAARARDRGACRRAGEAPAGTRVRARSSAISSARCTRSTASTFHLEDTVTAIGRQAT